MSDREDEHAAIRARMEEVLERRRKFEAQRTANAERLVQAHLDNPDDEDARIEALEAVLTEIEEEQGNGQDA